MGRRGTAGRARRAPARINGRQGFTAAVSRSLESLVYRRSRMSRWKKAEDRRVLERLADEAFYAKAAEEMGTGLRREGLWAKAIATTDGDESKAHAKYISLLAGAIRDEAYLDERAAEEAEAQRRALVLKEMQPPGSNEPMSGCGIVLLIAFIVSVFVVIGVALFNLAGKGL